MGAVNNNLRGLANRADLAGARAKFQQTLNKMSEGFANSGFQEADQAAQFLSKGSGGGQ